MRCYGLISGIGSEARFSFPANHSLPTTPILPDSCSRLSFRPFAPIIVSPVRARYASLMTKATINDEFLTEPEAAAMSFYELLGIPESGTLLEIKQAYKSLARKYHPDVSPPGRVKEYTRRFIWVQEAYETLSDPQRRALYDRDLAMGLHLAFSARKTYHRDEVFIELFGVLWCGGEKFFVWFVAVDEEFIWVFRDLGVLLLNWCFRDWCVRGLGFWGIRGSMLPRKCRKKTTPGETLIRKNYLYFLIGINQVLFLGVLIWVWGFCYYCYFYLFILGFFRHALIWGFRAI